MDVYTTLQNGYLRVNAQQWLLEIVLLRRFRLTAKLLLTRVPGKC
jgi:hypothetical protein